MLIGLSIAVSVGAVGCYYYLFRPVRPKWTQAELDEFVQSAQLPGDSLVWKVVNGKLSNEQKQVIQRAFRKGPDFRWIAAGKDMDEIIHDPKEHSDASLSILAKDHRDLVNYMIKCMLAFLENYSTAVIAAYDATTDEFVGSMSLVPPEYTTRSKKWLYQVHFLSSVMKFGQPLPVKQGPGPAARFQAFDDGCTILKNKIIQEATSNNNNTDSTRTNSTAPHWTVEVVAVADQAQGRGIGRQLLTLAKHVSTKTETPMYLCCHQENLAFYQKMGFREASRHTMTPRGIEDTTSLDFYGLTFTPK